MSSKSICRAVSLQYFPDTQVLDGHMCVRTDETSELKDRLLRTSEPESIIITGSQGIGKTCMLDSAIRSVPGVVEVYVLPGEATDKIIERVHLALGRDYRARTRMCAAGYARRVVEWHTYLFRSVPTVILKVPEYSKSSAPQEVSRAVSSLVHGSKVRVIVECLPNLVHESHFSSYTQVIAAEPMDREKLWEIPQFQDLFRAADACGMSDLLWYVCGGYPSFYRRVWSHFHRDSTSNVDHNREVLGRVLCQEIWRIVSTMSDSEVDMSKIVELYRQGNGSLTFSDLVQSKTKLPPANPMFDVLFRDGCLRLFPNSKSMSIVLKHKVTRRPKIEELKFFMLYDQVEEAVALVNQARAGTPGKSLLDDLKASNFSISSTQFQDRDVPDMSLVKVAVDARGEKMFVPTSEAVKLVIEHDLKVVPTHEELRRLIAA